MFNGERFLIGKISMEAYFAQGRVRVFLFRDTRMMVTEIDLGGAKISVARGPLPHIIPKTYGEITIERDSNKIVFPIKRTVYERPDFVVEEPTGENGFLGRVYGNRLDLALAYNLGISDEFMAAEAAATRIQPGIPDRIAEIVFS